MNWSKIPSLASLRAFEAAARYQSFTKAAAELNVTQAAIAQHVRALETEFSETLVVRQGRGIAITAVGQLLADSLLSGFSTIQDGVEDMRVRSELRPLNITITPAFAANWLMPRIGDFWSRHPEISLNINPSTKLIDLRKDEFDLAIRYGDGNWPGLQSALITDSPFWVVAHPDLVKGRKASCLEDLENMRWFLEEQMLERKSVVECQGVDFTKNTLTLLKTNGLVMAAVKAGLGLGLQLKSLAEGEVAQGELVKICELDHSGYGYYTAVVPGRQPKGLREFMSWLQEQGAA